MLSFVSNHVILSNMPRPANMAAQSEETCNRYTLGTDYHISLKNLVEMFLLEVQIKVGISWILAGFSQGSWLLEFSMASKGGHENGWIGGG